MERAALYASRFAGQTGQGLFIVALLIIAGGTSTSADGWSTLLGAMMLASILFALPAGTLVDWVGPARGLVVGACLRVGAMAIALAVFGHPQYAAAVAFAYSGASQVFTPSELSLVRELGPASSSGAHAVLLALKQGGQAVGALALAPPLYLLGGVTLMVGVAGAACIVVAALGCVLVWRLPPVQALRPTLAWRATVRYVRSQHRAAYAAGLLAFAEVAGKCLAIALPVILLQELQLTRIQIGVVVGCGALGALIGGVWTARRFTVGLALRTMRLTLLASVGAMLVFALLMTVLMPVLHLTPLEETAGAGSILSAGFVGALPAAFVLGACASIAWVGARAIFSETAPRATQGKVFATHALATDVSLLAPLAIVTATAGIAGGSVALLVIVALGAALFVALEWVLPRRYARGSPRIA